MLGGKTRGIKFGNRALLDIMTKHKFGTEAGIKFSFDVVVDLVYFGLLNNCLIKKENVDFTVDEVIEWVDDLPMTKLMEVFAAFQESYTGEKQENTKSTANKKK